MSKKLKLAEVFNAQVNPNAVQRVAWTHTPNALTKSDSNYAVSHYTKTTSQSLLYFID